ncbi:MAG TPA: hypothetical protein DCO71_07025 [Gammaproteobacteria bacterium]|nr:hypothetical protein [Gammaproteobacteria bacterium]
MAHCKLHSMLLVLLTTLATGCSTLPNGQRWGENAAFPSWDKLKSSAWKAARDPHTWAPLAGALVLSVGDLDEDLSDWALREQPLFGSESSADDASDIMADGLAVAAIVSALATPGGPGGTEWSSTKLKGMLVEISAALAAGGVTSVLKDNTGRTRPDDSDDRSMPSAHASAASSFAVLTSRNLDAIDMSPVPRKVLKYSAGTVAAATAWARVESKDHYPTDVLAGAALGYFITAVFHDSMMGVDTPVRIGVDLDGNNGGMLTFHMPF